MTKFLLNNFLSLFHVSSNIDVAKSILASIRQITAMEAGICFVMNNFAKNGEIFSQEELETFQKSVNEVKVKICKVRRTTMALKNRISTVSL